MKPLSRLLVSLAAVAACATTVHAAPFDAADQARRDQNREEVLARHGVSTSSSHQTPTPPRTEKKTIKTETKRAVIATENFGHRSADRMRAFGARTNAKLKGQSSTPAKNPYNHGPQ